MKQQLVTRTIDSHWTDRAHGQEVSNRPTLYTILRVAFSLALRSLSSLCYSYRLTQHESLMRKEMISL